MKRFLHFILIVGLLSGCVDAEIDEARQSLSSVMPNVINISLDDDTTRVQLNASGKTVWTEDDCVSAFYMSDANNKFRFNGETGDRDGKFIIESMGTATTDIDNIVLLYPYSSSYKLNAAKSQIDVYIPSTQYYAEGSYGVGANIMASVETDDDFTLKSLCGWIVVQLKGDATITNITLSGNNGEQLAGDADFDYADFNLNLVYYPNGSNIYGDSNVGGSLVWGDCLESITLDCGDGIALNPDKPTEFYFVVPPQKFTKGITIEAECLRGEPIVKSSSKALTVQRNHIVPMSTITANEVIPNNQIWYTSSDGEVVEPDDDTAFGATLLSNTYINDIGVITFNGEVTTIGEYAFSYCESLTSITIPDSATEIGEDAFSGCDSLRSVTIPDSVTSIGNFAFYDCTSLRSVTIPDSVTSIGNFAFGGCNSLTAFYGKFASEDNRCLIIDGVLNSFAPSELTQYTIPDSVTTVGYGAFYGCDNLTSVTIPDSVITIGDGAFNACNGLTEITIPVGATSIECAAFMGCEGLMYATIPASVTQIGEGAFAYCESLTSVFCKATTPPSVDDGIFLDNAAERKIYVPAEAVDAYKSAKGWSDYADYIIGYDFEKGEIFAKQKLVYTATSIVSPDSTDFGDANIMYNNFDATTGIGVIGFDREVTSIGEGAFSGCDSLTSVTIPDSVTSIGNAAFEDCTSLTSVTIPDSVTSIGDFTFGYCDSLTSVTIPDSVTSIGNAAFNDCDSLTSVYCKPTTPPSLGEDAFKWYDSSWNSVNIGCALYVPTASVEAYKSAAYWSDYASDIVGYEF
ncbi:MAG: leucine-rich repeat domain-containing protein [Alistipes sp.]|nr:leucine-rich repeat domain-containing protein [Alistipes sp.]